MKVVLEPKIVACQWAHDRSFRQASLVSLSSGRGSWESTSGLEARLTPGARVAHEPARAGHGRAAHAMCAARKNQGPQDWKMLEAGSSPMAFQAQQVACKLQDRDEKEPWMSRTADVRHSFSHFASVGG